MRPCTEITFYQDVAWSPDRINTWQAEHVFRLHCEGRQVR